MTDYIGWLNQNSMRGYPLAESSTRMTVDGQLFPDNVLVDLQLVAPIEYLPAYVRSVVCNSRMLSLSIVSSVDTPLAACTVAIASIEPYKRYPLVGLDRHSSGYVCFGELPPGEFRYVFGSEASSAIEMRCVTPATVSEVSSLSKLGSRNRVTDGMVTLRSSGAVQLRVDPEGCYEIVDPEPAIGVGGMYLPSGDPKVFVHESNPLMTLRPYGTGWKVGLQSPAAINLSSLPTLGTWTFGEVPGLVSSIYAVRYSLVMAGLRSQSMHEFLSQCYRKSAYNRCGSPVLRTLGGAVADEDAKITVLLASNEEA